MTFGGGDPTLAALHTELVGIRNWITSEKYALVFALARITPGTNLLAFCVGVSWQLLGWVGALASVLAMTVPAAILVVVLSGSYVAFASNHTAMATMGGVLAAAVGMMPAAAWQLARPYMKGARRLHTIVVFGGSIALRSWIGLSPVAILGIALVSGLLWRIKE
jgi:chromate transporter